MLIKAWKDPRILQLAKLLKMPLPHVMGHLEAMLLICYDHVPESGIFEKDVYNCLESWAMWEGPPGHFARSLAEAASFADSTAASTSCPGMPPACRTTFEKRWCLQARRCARPAALEKDNIPENFVSREDLRHLKSRAVLSRAVKASQARPSRQPSKREVQR